MVEFLRVRHHDALEIEILQDLVSEDGGISAAVFKHEVHGFLRQRRTALVVALDVLMGDGHVTFCLQRFQMLAKLLLADQGRRIADTIHAEVGKRDETGICGSTHLFFLKGLVGFLVEKSFP